MSGHRHPSQNTISSHKAAVFSNDTPEVSQPISLLQTPPEIVVRILLYLPPHDIISCARTCRMLLGLCSCAELRYLVQLERSAVIDDMHPGLSYLERLRILESREEAWAKLDFRGFVQVSLSFEPAGTYYFTDGVLAIGMGPSNADRQTMVGYSYISLPSLSDSQDQTLEWRRFSLETEILDFGLAVHEHDLIVVLTVKADVRHHLSEKTILEIRLLSLSTSQPHPIAEEPNIFIATKSLPLGIYSTNIEIVGDFLILFVTFEGGSENEDIFLLVRWKKGKTYDLRSPEWGTYVYLSFLSQDTLVIPNLDDNALEVAKIVIDDDDSPRLVPLCVLHLPSIAQDASLLDFYCDAEPNPTSSGHVAIPPSSDRPFHDKAEDAIMIFDIYYGHLYVADRLTFIVHRHALLTHIPAAHRACKPFSSAPEPPPALVLVPWSAWGPAATRWFEGADTSMGRIMKTAGQRAVTLENSMPAPIILRDFNQYAVRAARAMAAASGQSQQGNWTEQLPNGNRMTLNVEDSVIPMGLIFGEDVRSSLPYIEIVTQDEYHYDRAMIDDQRILGLKSSQEDGIRTWSFDVHVLG